VLRLLLGAALLAQFLTLDMTCLSALSAGITGPRAHGGRSAARKFTVIYRQQLGRKLHVNKISFTRFTNSVIFPDFYRDIHIPLGPFGGLEKVFWVEREEILRFWGGISLLD
jgi:hypothetical protein